MNVSQIYNAIQTGNREDMRQALFELLSIAQVLSTATLELAGDVRLKTGRDPLMTRSRELLSEFIEMSPAKDI